MLILQRFATATVNEEAVESGKVTEQGEPLSYEIVTIAAHLQVEAPEGYEGGEATVEIDGQEVKVTISADGTVEVPEGYEAAQLEGLVAQITTGQGVTISATGTFTTASGVILNVVDGEAAPDGTYTLCAAPLRIRGGEAAPCRAMLLDFNA